MKRLFLSILFLTGLLFSAGAEKISKQEGIDNTYSIAWTLDTDSSSVELTLLASNSDAYDESLGNNCIDGALSEIMADYGYSDCKLVSSSKEYENEEKYTKVTKVYSLYQ